MESSRFTQPEHAVELLRENGIMRLSEFGEAGISRAAIQRLEAKGQVVRLERGLYQLAGTEPDAQHALAEAAKHVPKGVICLTSALAFHELTDTIPSKVWMAIGPKDWKPEGGRLEIVRFGPKVYSTGIETHPIEGVAVPIYDANKTIVDMFRYRESAGTRFRKSPGLGLAIEGLREGLRTRKATPAKIAAYARQAGIWKAIVPYLDAMTAHV